jgi:hypothetical protein
MTVKSTGDVLDYGTRDAGNYASIHFDAADTIRFPRQYADDNRDPRESDSIGKVWIQVTLSHSDPQSPSTFYDPVSQVLWFDSRFYFDRKTLVHEYGHFLEHRISRFLPVPANHDGCNARMVPGSPILVNSQGHAWMEGFASWFSAVVSQRWPQEIVGPGSGTDRTFNVAEPCTAVGRRNAAGELITTTMIEDWVTSTLWDLSDVNDRSVEPHDPSGDNHEREVFQIFDRELGRGDCAPTSANTTCPNLLDFHRAWVARGLDDEAFDRVASGIGGQGGGNRIDWRELAPAHQPLAMDRVQSAVQNFTGGITVFVRGGDGMIWLRAQNRPGGAFGPWSSLPGLTAMSPPSVIRVPAVGGWPASIDIFVRNTNHLLSRMRLFSDGTQRGWNSMYSGGQLSSAPNASVQADGRIEVYARRADGGVAVAYQTVPGAGFTYESIGGEFTSGISAVALPDGHVEVWGRGTDDAYWFNVKPAGAAWTTAGGETDTSWERVSSETFRSAPVAFAEGQHWVHLFGLRSDSRLIWHNYSSSIAASWAGWTSIPLASDEGAASLPDVFVSPTWPRGLQAFFLTDIGAGLRRLKQASSASNSEEFGSNLMEHGGVQTLSAPEIAVDSDGRLVLFARGTDFQLYVRRQTSGTTWGPWSSLGGVVAAIGTN